MLNQRNRKKRVGKTHLRAVKPHYSLCYGMRLDRGTTVEQAHPHVLVELPNSREGEMALHVINGTLGEIRMKLQQSIDAFFEIYPEKNK
jgi:hypothetical protein